jgi:hypothetical protein
MDITAVTNLKADLSDVLLTSEDPLAGYYIDTSQASYSTYPGQADPVYYTSETTGCTTAAADYTCAWP